MSSRSNPTSASGAVSAAWRAALRPPPPSLLLTHHHRSTFSISAWSLSSSSFVRSTVLNQSVPTVVTLHHPSICVGSGDGWVAVSGLDLAGLMNPLTGEEIPFQFKFFPKKKKEKQMKLFKVVFAPNPTASDFTAAVITGGARVTYTINGNNGWIEVNCPCLDDEVDGIADVVYREKCGEKMVYCLMRSGGTHVLLLRHQKPATFQPLLDKPNTVFYPNAAFAPPYNTIRSHVKVKNLVLCDDGSFYQIWRSEDICTLALPLPGGGEYHVEEDQIFVLKYYPCRRPYWVEVKDLGGYSFFVGKNNVVALRVEDDGGMMMLRSNCVYWIKRFEDRAKVLDVKTGKSMQCFPDAKLHSAICWYNLRDTL
uniref:KIB1-4 beta-propeller domain-containing protein n=1 Tax=Leersia perrieri TaxID=77586 RepID=A0A0D9X3Z8_9ORYZ